MLMDNISETSVKRLIHLIGLEASIKLMEIEGGRRMYIPVMPTWLKIQTMQTRNKRLLQLKLNVGRSTVYRNLKKLTSNTDNLKPNHIKGG